MFVLNISAEALAWILIAITVLLGIPGGLLLPAGRKVTLGGLLLFLSGAFFGAVVMLVILV